MKMLHLPVPTSINGWWNIGSLLGLVMVAQLATGVSVSIYYLASSSSAFDSVLHLMRDIPLGWEMRILHTNGASLVFILLYLHMFRGIFNGSYQTHSSTWVVGWCLYMLCMVVAFLGYVLPWGQMSFWGATVITNFVSGIPFIGQMILEWVWGGFSVSSITLMRFYTLHFLLPFAIIILSMGHMMTLHMEGSSSSMGSNPHYDMISFHPLLSISDTMWVLGTIFFFMLFVHLSPWALGDPDNFMPANPLSTPLHIKPEWYFLYVYAILRSVPSKLGGIIAMGASLLSLLILFLGSSETHPMYHSPVKYFSSYAVLVSWVNLTILGGKSVSYPYLEMSKFCAMVWFLCLMMILW